MESVYPILARSSGMGNSVITGIAINYRGGYSSLAFLDPKETKTTRTYINSNDHMALNTCGPFYVKNSTLNRGEGDKNKF